MKKYDINVGDEFGRWKVISLVSKPGYVKCECVCGTIRDIPANTLARGKTTSCGCGRRAALKEYAKISAAKHFENAQKKVGTTVNGFKILSVERKEYCGANQTFCKVVCPKCGKESETLLSRLPYIQKCVNCNRNTSDFLGEMRSTYLVDKSSLASARSRIGGKVNKNSSTKANGVSKQKNGKYVAYLTFKRKHYHLGTYDNIEDAIAARKEGEQKIFGEYIKAHEGWEDELKAIAKESRAKNHKKRSVQKTIEYKHSIDELKAECEKLMQRIAELEKMLEEDEIDGN